MKQVTSDAQAETAALIAELWQRHLPALRERLAILDRIADSAAAHPLTEEDRAEAIAISHKFAGSLGMYGYSRGSEVAMKMEHLFRSLPLERTDLVTPLVIELRQSLFPS